MKNTTKDSNIKNKLSTIKSETFSDLDLCELSIELFYDIIFHNNPDYVSTAIRKSGFAEKIYELLAHQSFENHPLKIFFEKNIKDFDAKSINDFLMSRFHESPDLSLFVMKHDDKRATVFVAAQIYAAVGQLKTVNEDCLKSWIINVKTDVGSFRIN